MNEHLKEERNPDISREVYDMTYINYNIDDVKFNTVNYAICEAVTDNANDRTKSGIYKVSKVLKQHRTDHADILFRVIVPPSKLVHAKNISEKIKYWEDKYFQPMDWETDIEIKSGDLVVCKPKHTYNCVLFKEGNKRYYRLHYQQLVMSFKKATELQFGKRKRKIRIIDDVNYYDKPIMLNGYIACEEITERAQSKWIIDPFNKVDYQHGIVLYRGKPNKSYHNCITNNRGTNDNSLKNMSDDNDIKEGDKVAKEKSEIHILLQSSLHKIIDTDKNIFITQAHDIVGKYC